MSTFLEIQKKLDTAPSVKGALQLPFVQERFIANYMAVSGASPQAAKAKFESETFAYLEIVNEKPDLQKADRFSQFAAIVKAGTTGLSFRDNKLYVMPGPNNTVKVQSSPAGKREMMERMKEIKRMPEPQVVVKGDIFVQDKLNNLISEHKTTEKSLPAKLENILFSYQRIEWADGSKTDVVIDSAALLRAKSKSKAQSDQGFWGQWPDEACKKVATNRAYRLYHKYPDGIITYGKDEEKEEIDETKDVAYTDDTTQATPEAEVVEVEDTKPDAKSKFPKDDTFETD